MSAEVTDIKKDVRSGHSRLTGCNGYRSSASGGGIDGVHPAVTIIGEEDHLIVNNGCCSAVLVHTITCIEFSRDDIFGALDIDDHRASILIGSSFDVVNQRGHGVNNNIIERSVLSEGSISCGKVTVARRTSAVMVSGVMGDGQVPYALGSLSVMGRGTMVVGEADGLGVGGLE